MLATALRVIQVVQSECSMEHGVPSRRTRPTDAGTPHGNTAR
jgi:hypothetical protein